MCVTKLYVCLCVCPCTTCVVSMSDSASWCSSENSVVPMAHPNIQMTAIAYRSVLKLKRGVVEDGRVGGWKEGRGRGSWGGAPP